MNAFIFVFLIATSCTYLEKKISLNFDTTKNDIVNEEKYLKSDEVKNDLHYLKYALRKAYSGYFFKNTAAIEAGIRALNQIQGNMPVKQLCNAIANSFHHVRDKHLSFQVKNKKCKYTYAKGNVGLRKNSSKNKTWTVGLQKHKGKQFLLITISWFPSSSSPNWEGFLQSVKNNIHKADSVILDMRGNTGGDDSIGYSLAKLLAHDADVVTPYSEQHKVVTPAGLESRWNLFKLHAKNSKSKEEKIFFAKTIENDSKKYSKSKFKTVVHHTVSKKIQNYQLIKPVYILQDNACASSCESTIDFFEYLSPVTKIGENTAGFIHFGNMGFTLLPQSLIQVNIPSTYQGYRDGRFIEAVGIKPDIKVEQGKDAFDIAIKHFVSSTR